VNPNSNEPFGWPPGTVRGIAFLVLVVGFVTVMVFTLIAGRPLDTGLLGNYKDVLLLFGGAYLAKGPSVGRAMDVVLGHTRLEPPAAAPVPTAPVTSSVEDDMREYYRRTGGDHAPRS
jgi:hypothetical protein